MKYQVRKAVMADLPRIEEIYAYARSFMAANGNPNQWGTDKPYSWQLMEDIKEELLFVAEDQTGIHGVFYFYIGPDPTYQTIYDGAWKLNETYGTIHRIAGDGSGGILSAAVAHCLKANSYLRIDTHADNLVMQRALAKQGFQPSGIIYISDGTPRIAYERLPERV